jgi:hypothetical protein
MRCYYTGDECDCGNDLDEHCPHDTMEHEDELEESFFDMACSEMRMADMSHQLEKDHHPNAR